MADLRRHLWPEDHSPFSDLEPAFAEPSAKCRVVRHPDRMGEAEVTAFLSHLAVDRRVAPSTLTQALAALQFLYREIVRRPLAIGNVIPRPQAPVRLPVVLTPDEVRRVPVEL